MLKLFLSLGLALNLMSSNLYAHGSPQKIEPYIQLQRDGDMIHAAKCRFESGQQTPECDHLWHMSLDEYRGALRTIENKSAFGRIFLTSGRALLVALVADTAFRGALAFAAPQRSLKHLKILASWGIGIGTVLYAGVHLSNAEEHRKGLLNVLESIASDQVSVNHVILPIDESVWHELNRMTPNGLNDHGHHHSFF